VNDFEGNERSTPGVSWYLNSSPNLLPLSSALASEVDISVLKFRNLDTQALLVRLTSDPREQGCAFGFERK